MTGQGAIAGRPTLHLHASAVSWAGRGVLVRGAPGAGKSALATRLIAAGAYLVADDVVRLSRCDEVLLAAGVAAPGLIELRGSGIFRLATKATVRVNLCVELNTVSEDERLPEARTIRFLDVDVPLLVLDGDGDGPAAVARVLVALAARRVD